MAHLRCELWIEGELKMADKAPLPATHIVPLYMERIRWMVLGMYPQTQGGRIELRMELVQDEEDE